MANPELGAKQICPNCQAKFYDLNKRPAHCPKCEAEFDPEEVVKTRRVRSRTVATDYEDEVEKPAKVADPEADEFEEEADDTPEIDAALTGDPLETDEDADEDPAAPAAPPSDDLGVDFAEDEEIEADDDVPFLEEEDDEFSDDEIDGLPSEDDRD